jgi:hypothetical protein
MNRTYTLRRFNYSKSAPLSGAGPAGRREHKNDACAPLLHRTASHPMTPRGQAEARPTKTKSSSASQALAAIALAAIALATIAAPAARRDLHRRHSHRPRPESVSR